MPHDSRDNGNQTTWYALLILGVVALAVAGYTGYVLYPRFELPAVTGASLFLLAAAAGIGSFFSPCSFPLLVTLLARETGAEREGGNRRVLLRALRFALALALGAAAFLLLAGAAIAAGGAPLFEEVTFTSTAGRTIRIVVGALLILLGLIQTNDSLFPLGRSPGWYVRYSTPRRACGGRTLPPGLRCSALATFSPALAEQGPFWPVWPDMPLPLAVLWQPSFPLSSPR